MPRATLLPRARKRHLKKSSQPPSEGLALKPIKTESFLGNCLFCLKAPELWLQAKLIDALDRLGGRVMQIVIVRWTPLVGQVWCEVK